MKGYVVSLVSRPIGVGTPLSTPDNTQIMPWSEVTEWKELQNAGLREADSTLC